MNIEKITTEFKEVLRPYSNNIEALESLNGETDFIKDLKINSANLVDVFLDAEEKFDIEISNDSLEIIKNVGDAIRVISEKIQENNMTA